MSQTADTCDHAGYEDKEGCYRVGHCRPKGPLRLQRSPFLPAPVPLPRVEAHTCPPCEKRHAPDDAVLGPHYPITYVIRADGSPLVKIGHTVQDPQERLGALQTGSPHRLYLLWFCHGSAYLERALHRHFAAYRVRGEWFDLTPLGSDPVSAVQRAILTLREDPR